MNTREIAEVELASTLKAWRDMGLTSEHQENLAIARNVTNEEMGRYGEHALEYSLQQKTKDTLLAHGRQDVAHALCNTKSILDQNARISAQLRKLNFMATISVCLLAAIVVKLYNPQLLFAGH
jgi:hypothetical protein